MSKRGKRASAEAGVILVDDESASTAAPARAPLKAYTLHGSFGKHPAGAFLTTDDVSAEDIAHLLKHGVLTEVAPSAEPVDEEPDEIDDLESGSVTTSTTDA